MEKVDKQLTEELSFEIDDSEDTEVPVEDAPYMDVSIVEMSNEDLTYAQRLKFDLHDYKKELIEELRATLKAEIMAEVKELLAPATVPSEKLFDPVVLTDNPLYERVVTNLDRVARNENIHDATEMAQIIQGRFGDSIPEEVQAQLETLRQYTPGNSIYRDEWEVMGPGSRKDEYDEWEVMGPGGRKD